MNLVRKKITGIVITLSLVCIPIFAFSQETEFSVPETTSGSEDFSIQEVTNPFGNTPEEIENNLRALSEELNNEMIMMTTKDSVVFEMFPKYPKPNEEVSARLSSTLIDLRRADVAWYVDREEITSGVGLIRFNFQTKNTGETTRLGVVIESIDGLVVEKVINITPIEMELLWEADTYTPPFYKGKALLTPNSPVKIVAMPKIKTGSGRDADPKTFVYLWESKISTFQESSGYGKNVLYTDAPRPYRDDEISVRVSTLDGSLESKSTFDVKLDNPIVLFYENHPTEGVRYDNAINDGFNLGEKEIAIKAEPYFFAKNDKAGGNLTYDWLLNGSGVTGEGGNITLRQEGEGGVARVNIDIKNIVRKFQSARSSFELSFGNTGLFSF